MKTVSIMGKKGWGLAAAAVLLLLLCCGAAAEGASAYDLWLGGVQVTSANRNDILGDGKAGYDPATHTLTLRSGASIPGVHENGDSATAKIYAENMPLSVTGTYHMDAAEAQYGVMVYGGTLSLGGSLTFRGTLDGAFSGTQPAYDPDDPLSGDPSSDGGAVLTGTVALYGGRDGLRVDGDVSLNGSITLDGGTCGLFAVRKITVNGTADITGGQMGAYAHGGDFDMLGGQVSVSGSGKYGLQVHGADFIVRGGALSVTSTGGLAAILVSGDACINGGRVTAVCQARTDHSRGLKCTNGTVRISGDAESVEVEGWSSALEAPDLVITNADGQHMQISAPLNAFFDTRNGTIVQRTGRTTGVVVEHAVINHDYILYLGQTRVNADNQDDIFSDGRASFDPATNTLTLNDPLIDDCLTDAEDKTIKIFSGNMPLTIQGSYSMPDADVDYGVYVKDGAVTLNGDFTFRGTSYGIIAGTGMTVSGGNVIAIAGSESGVTVLGGDLTLAGGSFQAAAQDRGVNINRGRLIITSGIESVRFQGADYAAILAYYGIILYETDAEGLYMPSPGRKYIGSQTVYDPDYIPPDAGPIYVPVSGGPDPAARDVQFASCHLYGLSVSGVRVTSANADDILGGGTVRYDPDTQTLTLNEPDLSGSVNDSSAGFDASCAILATGVSRLTVKGKWHQSEPQADFAIRVAGGSLVLDGSFAVKGQIAGLCADGDLVIASGGTSAFGGEVGAVAHRLAIGNRCGYLELESSVDTKEPGLFDEEPEADGWPDGYRFTLDTAGFCMFDSINTAHYQRSGACLIRKFVDEPLLEKITRVRITDLIGFDGAGSEDDPYQILSEDDWNRLATNTKSGADLSRKHFALMNDIAVTTMIGTSDHPFSAVFDGRGHTLTFTFANTDNNVSVAPFAYTGGATIRNLRVAGAITGSKGRAAGLIGENRNAVSQVVNCRVSASISGSYYISGFCVGEGPGVCFTGCVFDGSITATDKGGGFAGWSEQHSGLRFVDCVFAPESVAFSAVSGTFFYDQYGSGSQVLTNCYYLTTAGIAQGMQPFAVTAGTGVTVDFGTPAANYDVSGITAYRTGLQYGGAFRAGAGETVILGLAAEPWEGHALSFAAGAEVLTETSDGWALTMPAADAVITVRHTPTFATAPILRLTFEHGTGGYNHQGPEYLFDGLDDTKWCAAFTGENWVEFRADYPVLPTACAMTTGGDTARYPGRNPVTWRLLGRESTDDGWTVLTEQADNDHLPPENCAQVFFPLYDAAPCRFFRLEIVSIQSGGTVQLSGFSLVGTPVFGTAAFTLPSALTELGESAFEGMTAMTAVDAGHCTTVGRWAFRNCTGLNRIRLPWNCAIDADAFAGCGTVYIFAQPGGSTEAYCGAHENCVFVAE